MNNRWSDVEIKFIKENYLKMNSVVISQHLKRSPHAVKMKMKRLGLILPKDIVFSFMSQSAINRNNNIESKGEQNPNWRGGISKNNYHYKKLQIERYPEKINARRIVALEIRAGRLARGCCEVCGKSSAHAHHDDYNKPLEIKWLCQKHHNALHNSRL
ncbi:MAG: hypothetical protein CVT92_02150 [Bacteroidetes bacterium HGW-Bacteroidetes-1]|jgi:hypothetical protein|nr:MAG: hypothetical protein CVT92_02150 [Bacteroidetes bacterium HGW-Bacteroidetes-1]